MAEGNGRQDNLSRLDRIEAAMELFVADHEAFRDEHKRLLRSQVLLQDSLGTMQNSQQTMQESQRKMQSSLDQLTQRVHEIGDKLDGLIGVVDRDHREFHERLKRLEKEEFNG